jgi:hypothetical protein
MTLRVAIVNAAFCFVTTALYLLAGMQPDALVWTFVTFSPFVLAILWLQKDVQRTHLGDVHDWGFFAWLFWPILLPWYAFKSRGRGGWRLLIALVLLGFPAYIGWLVVAAILYGTA